MPTDATVDPVSGPVTGSAAPPATAEPPSARHSPVKRDITCPHCWRCFLAGNILWIASHEDLRGDALLGPEEMRRFLPTRFNVRGDALDARGAVCHELACPACHLPIGRGLLVANQLYFSLIGVPGSGKSYFTAAMTWRLRTLLPEAFGVTFTDLDAESNQALIRNEQMLFMRPDDPGRLVSIEKTQMQGEHYDPIHRGGQTVRMARPFQFMMTAHTPRPQRDGQATPARVLNLYDNAGEHFLPGADNTLNPGTQHLARANAVMFLFDPLQDARFREVIGKQSRDPQIDRPSGATRQDTVLNEACARLRRYAGLSPTAQLDQPLLVLLAKADAWSGLVPGLELEDEPVKAADAPDAPVASGVPGANAVDTARVEDVSAKLRGWLHGVVPEFVALAEGLHKHVVYLPVSALGGPPVLDADQDLLMVKPGELAPRWAAAPVLYALAKWSRDGVA